MKKMLSASLVAAVAALSFSINLYAGDSGQFMADKHKAIGAQCSSCHGGDTKSVVANGKCLACHGSYDQLAEKTKDMHLNPHKNPHFLDIECAACHSGHKPLDAFCQNCHGPLTRHK
ncbi:cytochrome c3 family protein [Geobacter sp. FeAm09]|uniref:cytochrome c3 family protein n=1 Tax=Geobacter sp. FeAm09 TaxID=2597769 RepID=UPI0011EE3C09|nr:cytochrome c3 family protein [Geobacter sp. FeAm09]QEM67691.1 cytochrome c3 family protein [Geobacter sp. FeAm09]